MSSQFDVARALKDKEYFKSLSPDQQEAARREGGIGSGEVTDDNLESISGGGDDLNATGTDSVSPIKSGIAPLVICNC